jgi:LacI family transcriptional regulator
VTSIDDREVRNVVDEEGARPTYRGRANGAARATIYDVARLAGVNPSTVSRALSTPGRISAETERRIHAAADELHFTVNPIARALHTGRTKTLGLLVADITNPVFFNFVRGAERAAAASGYVLVLAESQESGEREAEAAERILPSVDGLILVTTRMSDPQIAALAAQKPVVVINREIDAVDSVVPALEPGIDQAVAHLADLGHRSVLFLAGPQESWMSGARWRLLEQRSRERGLSIAQIGPNAPTLDGGRSALPQVVAAGATAVAAYNDLMAIGLLLAARDAGWSLPGRLSILGFDDIFGADFTSPSLTTVRTPLGPMGETAVRRILAAVEGHPSEVARVTPATTELIIRRSTGRPAV